MTGQMTLIFQSSLQGAPLQARRAACWDSLAGQSRPACAHKQEGASAGRPAREAAPLTRRRPGSGVGAPRPGRCCTRCGRGLAGALLGRRPRRWRLDTGSRALWGERRQQGEGFQRHAAVEGPPHPDPAPCRPRQDRAPRFRFRESKVGAGRAPRSDSRKGGLVTTAVPVPTRLWEMTNTDKELFKTGLELAAHFFF